ncbi:MAG: hypothetical protein Q8R00_04395 [Candidatus Nanoarchaeia archaeon]|nr:hypothetical protein [Candidatus Nanoarchaeia archaeon]
MGKVFGWVELIYLILGILPFATYLGLVQSEFISNFNIDTIWLVGLFLLMLIQGLSNALGEEF